MSAQSPIAPSRQETLASNFSDEAVPEADPSHAAGLLAQRLQAWKHAVVYLEEYMEAVEKIHKAHAKEYERVLKTISKPLREGDHFDQSLGGVAGFFENMRVNTQALINTNLETEKHIKGSVLPIIERLHKEIKHKAKELSHGAEKGAKEVEKARNSTQKHIELLGQHTASYESTGHKAHPTDDPYVIRRGILHRLSKQVVEENNHRNDLIAVQANFQTFEAHVVHVMQESMEAFNSFAGGQAEKTRALYNDMLGAVQRIPPDFEWNKFVARKSDVLINPNDPPRALEGIQFPNMDHSSTKPLIEGTLERKSRNKLSWGTQTGYYVVTPCKFLHEFKDNDNLRKDPTPELSIYLPDAIIGAPHGEKFNVKGKDRSKTMSSKLTGHSELAFKAHTPADAEKWFNVIRNVAGATGPAEPSPDPSPVDEKANLAAATTGTEKLAINTADGHESGVTGGPAVLSPASATTAAPANEKHAPTALDTKGGAAAAVPTPPASAKAEKAPVALA
ncbi:hypothetical protein B0T26DRAFT_743152 [Lasiosphaeria miniovina]|uniref:PH domain-containing protein n=1 Tax=Lasiosphaeria miniovina TaxID=1954250 RepID=A0AA40DQQ6_9PEZI|nr:uncharacterized protein B0T26DRAFT_743152 [Lasiosphaeria miniovina]KAK0709777.1 hypothetical protein B0T26DRAFT_743152 [Lasiosphaeria miniovina]